MHSPSQRIRRLSPFENENGNGNDNGNDNDRNNCNNRTDNDCNNRTDNDCNNRTDNDPCNNQPHLYGHYQARRVLNAIWTCVSTTRYQPAYQPVLEQEASVEQSSEKSSEKGRQVESSEVTSEVKDLGGVEMLREAFRVQPSENSSEESENSSENSSEESENSSEGSEIPENSEESEIPGGPESSLEDSNQDSKSKQGRSEEEVELRQQQQKKPEARKKGKKKDSEELQIPDTNLHTNLQIIPDTMATSNASGIHTDTNALHTDTLRYTNVLPDTNAFRAQILSSHLRNPRFASNFVGNLIEMIPVLITDMRKVWEKEFAKEVRKAEGIKFMKKVKKETKEKNYRREHEQEGQEGGQKQEGQEQEVTETEEARKTNAEATLGPVRNSLWDGNRPTSEAMLRREILYRGRATNAYGERVF
jgi:hypothetical protein